MDDDGRLAKYLAEGLAAELQCSRDLTANAKWWLISDVETAIYKALRAMLELCPTIGLIEDEDVTGNPVVRGRRERGETK